MLLKSNHLVKGACGCRFVIPNGLVRIYLNVKEVFQGRGSDAKKSCLLKNFNLLLLVPLIISQHLWLSDIFREVGQKETLGRNGLK